MTIEISRGCKYSEKTCGLKFLSPMLVGAFSETQNVIKLVAMDLKSDSHLPKKIVLFVSLKVL